MNGMDLDGHALWGDAGDLFDLEPLVTNVPVRSVMDDSSEGSGSDAAFFPAPTPKELELSLLDGGLDDNLMMLGGTGAPLPFSADGSQYGKHFKEQPFLVAPQLLDEDDDCGDSVVSNPNSQASGPDETPPVAAGAQKRATGGDEETKRKRDSEARTVARRRKHNKIEIQRRKELAEQFSHLKQALNKPEKAPRGDVLQAAIERLRAYDQTVQQLEQQANKRRRRPQEDGAGDEANKMEPLSPEVARSAFLHSGVAMSVLSVDGEIVEVNDQFEELFKNTKDNLTQLSMFTITHPDYKPKTYRLHGDLLDDEADSSVAEMKSKLVNCDGDVLSAHVTSWVVADPETGKPKYVYSTIVPLEVEPKAAEELVHDSKK